MHRVSVWLTGRPVQRGAGRDVAWPKTSGNRSQGCRYAESVRSEVREQTESGQKIGPDAESVERRRPGRGGANDQRQPLEWMSPEIEKDDRSDDEYDSQGSVERRQGWTWSGQADLFYLNSGVDSQHRCADEDGEPDSNDQSVHVDRLLFHHGVAERVSRSVAQVRMHEPSAQNAFLLHADLFQ